MSKAWLRDLEERVQDACERLRHLRAENERLEGRVSELETKLAASSQQAETAWTEERDEIRGRVEKLAEHLEKMLDE